jgi:hypothetical protein
MAPLAAIVASFAATAAEGLAAAGSAVAAAAPSASTVAALSTAATVGTTLLAGQQAKQAGKFEQQQRERAANEERVASQRQAMEDRRKTGLTLSRINALGASSGAGNTNATIVDIMEETAGRGQYLANSTSYGGEQRARGQIDEGAAAVAKGRSAWVGSILEGVGEAANGYAGYRKLRAGGY